MYVCYVYFNKDQSINQSHVPQINRLHSGDNPDLVTLSSWLG